MSWYLDNYDHFFPTKEETDLFDGLWREWNRSVGIEDAISIVEDEKIRLMISFWKRKIQVKYP